MFTKCQIDSVNFIMWGETEMASDRPRIVATVHEDQFADLLTDAPKLLQALRLLVATTTFNGMKWGQLRDAGMTLRDLFEMDSQAKALSAALVEKFKALDLNASPYNPPQLEEGEEAHKPVTAEILVDMLGLIDITLTAEQVASLSQHDMEQAFDWAVVEHVAASDNESVTRYEMPEALKNVIGGKA